MANCFRRLLKMPHLLELFCGTDGKKHDHMAQNRARDGTPKQTLNQLYSIPPALPEELVKWLGANLLEKEE